MSSDLPIAHACNADTWRSLDSSSERGRLQASKQASKQTNKQPPQKKTPNKTNKTPNKLISSSGTVGLKCSVVPYSSVQFSSVT